MIQYAIFLVRYIRIFWIFFCHFLMTENWSCSFRTSIIKLNKSEITTGC